MKRHTVSGCDPGRLKRLIDNTLSRQEQQLLILHLDTCMTCQHRVEELAASPEEWERVRQIGRHIEADKFRRQTGT